MANPNAPIYRLRTKSGRAYYTRGRQGERDRFALDEAIRLADLENLNVVDPDGNVVWEGTKTTR